MQYDYLKYNQSRNMEEKKNSLKIGNWEDKTGFQKTLSKKFISLNPKL